MRQTLSKGMVVAAAATSALSLCGSQALADSGAHGAAQGSDGVLSGNTVQVPVDVPVNVCGNSVGAAAALHPAFGDSCANVHGSTSKRHGDDDSYGDLGDGSGHGDSSVGDQLPPPSSGSGTTPPPNGGEEVTSAPGGGRRHMPRSLPRTGGETEAMIAASVAGAALIATGVVLYRRGRAASRR